MLEGWTGKGSNGSVSVTFSSSSVARPSERSGIYLGADLFRIEPFNVIKHGPVGYGDNGLPPTTITTPRRWVVAHRLAKIVPVHMALGPHGLVGMGSFYSRRNDDRPGQLRARVPAAGAHLAGADPGR